MAADGGGVAVLRRAATDKLAHGTPQDDCRFRARCATAKLVPDRFVMFYYGKPQWRWEQAPFASTRARLEALFG